MDWAQQKGLAVLATFCFGKIYGTDTEQNIGLKREMEDWYSHRLREYRPVIKRKQTNAI